ncbi:MAG: FAD-binding and (Fe-S)-binding domain-containing protein, partial [Pseudoclavibacter sp.]
YDTPAEIFAHLVIGSEGTLAFVAEATFETVPRLAHASTSLLVFDDIFRATEALPALVDSGLGAIELLDAASLRVAAGDPASPRLITQLRAERHAALLIEHQRDDADDLVDAVGATSAVIDTLPVVGGGAFTSDAAERAAYWAVRKGLYAAVAGARPSGTTAMLEDIAVPVADLASTCDDLQTLFDRYEYGDSVIFGHAKDGNIHFLVNERFDGAGRLDAYEAFTDDLVDLVLGHGGTLKAEHGTGRIMAPFVERQYGAGLTDCMRELKRLADPTGTLNPGAVLTDDPRAHLRDIKQAPPIEEEADRCVECGYCEPVCPSRDLTLTPRQRIVARRELAAAEARGDHGLAAKLREASEYDVEQTCAVDGMCVTACPVGINTGDLVRRLRADSGGTVENAVWKGAAVAWGPATKGAGAALTVAKHVPAALVTGATTVGRKVLGTDRIPRYDGSLP